MTNICNEYAQALYILSEQNGITAEFSESMKMITKIFEENPDYTILLGSPAILLSERLSLIDSAFSESVHEYILSFLKLLCEDGNIDLICECANEFESLAQFSLNITNAIVYYVKEPDSMQKSALLKKLCDITQKTVIPEYIRDESLIGGLKIEIDGKTIDSSISGKLNKIKEVMSK